MSYTVVDDNGTFHIRAAINSPEEMQELLDKLDWVKLKLLSTKHELNTENKETNH